MLDADMCAYCGNPVRVNSFNNLTGLASASLNKYIASYKIELAEGNGSRSGAAKALAFCYLRLKLYEQALPLFDNAIAADPSDSEIFYYAAICLLRGKKAFLARRTDIDRALNLLDAAKEIKPEPLYYLLSAYIRNDFFARKGYSIIPSFSEELIESNKRGLPSANSTILFQQLGVERPVTM